MNQSDCVLSDPPTRSSLHLVSDHDYRYLSRRESSRRHLKRTSSLLVLVATIATLSSHSSAFVSKSNLSCRPRISLTAKATKTATKRKAEDFVVEQLQPRTSISEEDRQSAVDAMHQNARQVDLDAKILELLTDSFLVSPNSPTREKPFGRPSMVAGAMNFETMLKFQERNEAEQYASIVPYTTGDGTEQEPFVFEDLLVNKDLPKRKKNEKKSMVKGVKMHHVYEDGAKSIESINDSTKRTGKIGKKGVKNLPQARNRGDVKYDENKVSRKSKGKGSKNSALDLTRYYRTELLTAEEEYTFGMQVRFMVKCEQVHEGLSLYISRLPTFEEWASACG